jgi:hypothetical protein
MSTVAVFLAMGGAGAVAATHLGRNTVGTQQLKASSVTGPKVKDGSLTGADVNAASLGKVPGAAHADSAGSADRATTAGHADSAGRADDATHAQSAARADAATTAANATHATTADSATVASSLTAPEPVHLLNTNDEPKSLNVQVDSPLGFYRDHEGIVHFQGRFNPLVDTTMYGATIINEIPPELRPAQNEEFFGVSANASARISVYTDGAVEILGAKLGELMSLDGITWRPSTEPQA